MLELEGNLQPFVVSDSDVLISNLTKCVAELFWAVKLWDAKRNSPMYRAQYYTEIIRSIIAILRRVDAILFEIMKYSFYLDGRALEAYRYAIHNCTVAVRKEIAEGLFHDAFASYNKAFFPRSEAYYSAYLVDIANVRGDCFGTPDIPIPKQMGTERQMLIKAVSKCQKGMGELDRKFEKAPNQFLEETYARAHLRVRLDRDVQYCMVEASLERMDWLMLENNWKLLEVFDKLTHFLTQLNIYRNRGLMDNHDLSMLLQ